MANTTKSSSSANRQGFLQPLDLVDDPSCWYAEEYKDKKDWIHQLTEPEVAELCAAVKLADARKQDIKDIQKEDFPLPTLSRVLEDLMEDVNNGRGFALIKGVPVDKLSRREVLIAYWGMGLYWGKAVPQNKKGHLIGHIKDIGHDASNPVTRLYATNAAQPWHNDSADVVALLCLQNAKEGGLSSWSSSMAVYNEMLKQTPELVDVLAGEWYMDRKNEVPEGKKPYFMIPVLNFFKGFLSINFSDNYYRLSQRHPEVPRLTEAHLRAIGKFNELAGSKALRMDALLDPGDIQLLNNHTCLHTRGAFVDYLENEKKRHLLRLWIAPKNIRPLPEAYLEIYGGSVEVGNRGGIYIGGFTENIPYDAE